MKILPMLLINLVCVGGGLVIYDQMRGDDSQTTYAESGVDPVEFADLQSAVANMKAGDHEPALRSSGDENLLRRLEAIEKRFGASAGGTTAAPSAEGGSDNAAPNASGSPITVVGEDGPNAEEVRRFRKLMDAANEQRRMEREREQLATLLERLEITMDDKQTDQYLTARRARQESMRKVFTGLQRGEGVDREAMMEQINAGRAKVNEEFAVVINKFLPSGDAAKLVEHEGQSRWGSAMRTSGDRGRRGR